ncbi:MAG: sulfotransferase domain-containing protein [Patescibacteria group bacterium]|nr:sulfotransferase domain-containing protein [Patescibacteria group bacterium]
MKYYIKLLKRGLKEPSRIFDNLLNPIHNIFADIFVISYPKTGRTWLRVLLGKFFSLQYDLPEKIILDTYKISGKTKKGRILFSHEGPFNVNNYSKYTKLKFKNRRYKNKKVVFIIRDIRDVLVSAYFQEKKRDSTYDNSLSDFVRSDYFGVKKIITYYNLWFLNKQRAGDFLLIKYEDLRNDTKKEFEKILKFIGYKKLKLDIIDKAINYASFSNMKKMEKINKFNNRILNASKGDKSGKVRKGKVGGYVDYLSENDLIYIDSAVEEIGVDKCDWYFKK